MSTVRGDKDRVLEGEIDSRPCTNMLALVPSLPRSPPLSRTSPSLLPRSPSFPLSLPSFVLRLSLSLSLSPSISFPVSSLGHCYRRQHCPTRLRPRTLARRRARLPTPSFSARHIDRRAVPLFPLSGIGRPRRLVASVRATPALRLGMSRPSPPHAALPPLPIHPRSPKPMCFFVLLCASLCFFVLLCALSLRPSGTTPSASGTGRTRQGWTVPRADADRVSMCCTCEQKHRTWLSSTARFTRALFSS